MFDRDRCPACTEKNVSIIDQIASSEVICRYEGEGLKTPVSHLFSSADTRDILLCRCNDCDLRWYANSPSGDASFYEALQQHSWYYQSEKPEYKFAASSIVSGSKVLEVGCGRGAFVPFLPKDVEYRGLEFNDAAVAMAQKSGLNVQRRDLAQVAIESPGEFDVVCHFQVLEHVVNPLEFMQNAAAAVKPGGRLIVAVPAEDSFIGIAESSVLNMPPHHLTRWTDQALSSLLTKVGLKAIDIWHEEVAPYHTAWHRRVLFLAGLRDVLGARPQAITGRFLSLLDRVLYRVPGIRRYLIDRGQSANPLAARGHTVCVVATKPDRRGFAD